jgi:CubicO group peptidase (beta-lactamase class C family)
MLSGTHEPGFEPLARALEEVLGREPFGGAGLSVYQDGRIVFDMWGGTRDHRGAPWEKHTPSVSFSTTKGIASTALHMLADRGKVHYDDPVAKYWPEFSERGKGAITLRQVLNHSAGLYDVRNVVEHADVLLDWDATVRALAQAPAAHAPGRYHSYHAMTYGHLVGEIVSRVSGKPFSTFVADEIAAPLGLTDFFIGATDDAIARAARLPGPMSRRPPGPAHKRNPAHGRRRAQRLKLLQKALRLVGLPANFGRLKDAFAPRGIERWDMSSPEVLRACIPSVNGLFTARDLARVYAVLAAGGTLQGVRLMSPATVRQASEVQHRGPDGVILFPMGWRLGYHGVPTTLGTIKGAFGHFGYGGSGAWASPRHNASFALVVNAGAGTPFGDFRVVKLSGVAIGCIRARRRRAMRAA